MIDGASALGALSGGLSSVNSALEICKKVKKSDNPSLHLLVRELKPKTLELCEKILRELNLLKQSMLNKKLDMGQTLDQLEETKSYWRLGQYRLIRNFRQNINGIETAIGLALTDAVAVANCSEQEEVVIASMRDAKSQRDNIKEITDVNRPVGKLLDDLISYVEWLRAEIDSL